MHLHPAMQAELGDVFIESALGERKNTFLLETHSEHLILRILRRIRETTAEGKPGKGGMPAIRPEDVSVVDVQPGPKGAEVIELPVTPDGDFSRPWPKGFFAERAANSLSHDRRVRGGTTGDGPVAISSCCTTISGHTAAASSVVTRASGQSRLRSVPTNSPTT